VSTLISQPPKLLTGDDVVTRGTMDAWATYSACEHDRIRCLEIAGALIAAEIDRLLAEGKCERSR